MCLNGPRTQRGDLPFDGSNRQNMGHLVYIYIYIYIYYHLCYVCFSNLRHAQKVEVTLLSPFHVRQMVESQDIGFYGFRRLQD